MNRSMLRKLGLLASLYVSQGIPHGFRIAGPIFFLDRGVSLELIGLYALLLYTPWIFKFLWAPLVDRFYNSAFGRRRTWIIPMQCMMSLCVLVLGFLGEEVPLDTLLFFLALINLVSAIQDTATDGFGVDILEPGERGWGNGIQMGGYWSGYMIGGGVILILIDLIGWLGSFVVMSSLIAVCIIPVLLAREKVIQLEQVVRQGLFSFLRRPGTLRLLLFVMIFRSPDGFIRRWVTTMLSEKGYSIGKIGWLQGVAGPLTGLMGALLGGYLLTRISRRSALIGFALLQTVFFGAYALIAAYDVDSLPLILGAVIADHVIASMVVVVIFSFMMDQSSTAHGATDFTFQDCAGIFATIIVSILAGFIADRHSYTVTFGTGIVFVLVSVAAIFVLVTPEMLSHEKDQVVD